jgi:hypothetical protein
VIQYYSRFQTPQVLQELQALQAPRVLSKIITAFIKHFTPTSPIFTIAASQAYSSRPFGKCCLGIHPLSKPFATVVGFGLGAAGRGSRLTSPGASWGLPSRTRCCRRTNRRWRNRLGGGGRGTTCDDISHCPLLLCCCRRLKSLGSPGSKRRREGTPMSKGRNNTYI